MSEDVILSVRDLSVAYNGKRVVSDVTFDVHAGEVLAVVGESGSGKSSIALALMRLSDSARLTGQVNLRTSDGARIEVHSTSERKMRQLRGREMSMIFQEPIASLNPIYRIGRQMSEALRLHNRLTRQEIYDRSVELLNGVGITEADRCLNSYPHQLSGGQCQRIGIAMAMANKPMVLIADEPTTALDVTVQAQILDALMGLQKESHVSIIFVTHDLKLVRHFADRVLVMYAGQIVESGPTAQIFDAPLMPYTAALLASRPRLHPNARDRYQLEPIPGSAANNYSPPPGCKFHPRCKHMQPGRCDRELPAIELAGDSRLVRCLRWKELA